MKKKNIT